MCHFRIKYQGSPRPRHICGWGTCRACLSLPAAGLVETYLLRTVQWLCWPCIGFHPSPPLQWVHPHALLYTHKLGMLHCTLRHEIGHLLLLKSDWELQELVMLDALHGNQLFPIMNITIFAWTIMRLYCFPLVARDVIALIGLHCKYATDIGSSKWFSSHSHLLQWCQRVIGSPSVCLNAHCHCGCLYTQKDTNAVSSASVFNVISCPVILSLYHEDYLTKRLRLVFVCGLCHCQLNHKLPDCGVQL